MFNFIGARKNVFSTQEKNEAQNDDIQTQPERGVPYSLLEEISQETHSSVKASSEIIAKTLIQDASMESFTKDMDSVFDSIKQTNTNLHTMNTFVASVDDQIRTTSSAITQITSSISNTADIITERSLVTEELEKTAEDAETKMQEALRVIDMLSGNVDAIKDALSAINDISDQTNLLAMNAAIEAAHAGKQGLGFAVVAGEIRKLSAVTRSDSANIEKTLKGMLETLSSVRRIAGETSDVMKKIGDKAAETMRSFSQVGSEMKELSSAVGHIDNSSKTLVEQADLLKVRIAESADNMNTLDESAGNVKAAMEAIQGQSRKIADLAQEDLTTLDDSITHLRKIERDVFASQRVQAETGDFPFAGLLLGHLQWVTHVRKLISTNEKTTLKTTDHHSCTLGKWIDGPARSLGVTSLPFFAEMTDNHEKLHNLVIEIFKNFSSLSREEIEEKYSRLLHYSSEVISGLEKIKSAIAPAAVPTRVERNDI